MSRLLSKVTLACAIGVTTLVLAQTTPPAPAPTIKRTPLQTVDIPGTNFNTITAIAEIVPNASIGRHTHPGPEAGYVMEGEMTLMIDGQPPKVVKAGESYQVPAGAIHDAKSGEKGTKVLGAYMVEKGKPIASPAQ